MPTYTYRCLDCQRRFEIFLSYDEYGHITVRCPHCESGNVRRKIDRVRFAKSTESLIDDLDDPSALEGLEDDPVAMGKMMRRMGQEMGEELPPEFDEVVSRLEKGQDPDEIARDIPELGEMDAGIDDDF